MTVWAQMYPVGYAELVDTGFWDEKHNFLDRKTAYKIAKENGQFHRENHGEYPYTGEELFSEDLW
jgi:hypothetical protein